MSQGSPQYQPSRVVDQIADDGASDFLNDAQFVQENKLKRVFHIVRDPRNPKVILSMTVMETE